MRKIVIHRPGGTEVLRVERHPEPPVPPGHVRVDVEAIGVNFADCFVRLGLYESARKTVGWPITPGFEVAGRVDGQPVVALTRFGGYADTVVVPAHQVFALPDGLDMAQAAGFPTVFLTAWFALFELARPRPGATVLVHSAAGGVGSALVQLARHLQCRVIGVVGSPHKVDTARQAGAHVVIDKSSEALWQAVERAAPNGCDVICDANGVETLKQSYDHLAAPGRLVIYGFHTMIPRGRSRRDWPRLVWSWLRTPRFDPLRLTGDNRSVMGFNLSYLFERRDILDEAMTLLLELLAQGEIRALPVTEFPFEDVARAHDALQSGTTTGKLVLRTSVASSGRPA